MHRYLLHNNEIVDAHERGLSPGQVGLLNGWGVFSTMRVYDGVIFAWERHLARMQADAGKMRVPFPQQPERLEQNLHKLIEANQAWNATMRLVVVRNRGGMFEGPGPMSESDVMAFTRDVNAWGDTVKLGVIPNGRQAASEFAGIKYLSWSENLTRYERAREQGLDEVILLNERGEVCECTSANIFAVEGGQVWTPPLDAGCLPGVTRAVLLEEVRIPGIRVKEKILRLEDLAGADEVFITSTTRELLPVVSIEGLQIKQGRSTISQLQGAFRERIKFYMESRRKADIIV